MSTTAPDTENGMIYEQQFECASAIPEFPLLQIGGQFTVAHDAEANVTLRLPGTPAVLRALSAAIRNCAMIIAPGSSPPNLEAILGQVEARQRVLQTRLAELEDTP